MNSPREKATPGLPPISVAITSYNALELLEEYLPKIKVAFDAYAGGGEIIVVEDAGSDGTLDWLKTAHPEVRAIVSDRNRGFAATANRGVRESQNDIVVLLNNDMAPEGDLFAPLVNRIHGGEDIFAVTAKSIVADGGNESISVAAMDDGLITLEQPGLDPERVFDKAVTLFHAGGGFSAYRRNMFLELGGFDSIYYPIYWEDVDLSYRAWRRGWMSVYEPKAAVRHRSHGTMRKLIQGEKFDLMNFAHLHLFHLLNLENDELERYIRRVNRLMSEINLYDRGILRRGFYVALKRLDAVIERRKKMEKGKSLDEIIKASSLKPLEGE